jgi:tetratricopeptide (TPR) repeat protein
MDVYDTGHERTGEYRFKMLSGDLRIARLERELETMTGAEAEERARELLILKAGEYEERVKRYPTDRTRKYDLGVVHFELGNYEDAMAQLQKAKDEPRLRVRAGHLLGRCFLAENWYSDAAAEFDEALQALDATEKDRELGIKYDLMVALLSQAAEDRQIEDARRAKTICSEIARTDITYRDIRAKRKEVDDLIRTLSATVE